MNKSLSGYKEQFKLLFVPDGGGGEGYPIPEYSENQRLLGARSWMN